jgi:hypothetical protein
MTFPSACSKFHSSLSLLDSIILPSLAFSMLFVLSVPIQSDDRDWFLDSWSSPCVKLLLRFDVLAYPVTEKKRGE